MGLILRNIKGSKLTYSELDGNFTYLDQKINENIPSQTSVTTNNMEWQNVALMPGVNPVVTTSPFLNLNLSANSDIWQSDVIFNGINNLPNTVVDGTFGFLKNTSNLPILLKNNALNISMPLNVSTGQDFILMPDGLVSMVYSLASNKFNVIANNASSRVLLIPKSEVFRLTEAEASQPNVFLTLAENPSLNEFVDVYINGIHLNNDDVLIDGVNLVIARPNIEYNIKEGMQVTVNYKF